MRGPILLNCTARRRSHRARPRGSIGHVDESGVRSMRLGFQHTYGALPSRFYAPVAPTPVPDPRLVVFNTALAADLGLDARAIEPAAAAIFSGNQLPEDAHPISMVYAGHQFGTF